jgi:hypothetical protein
MNAKIYGEHHWVHTHETLHYNLTVRTLAAPSGYRVMPQVQAAYGKPFVTVLIGEEWMGDEPLQGDPEMTETAARHFVERRLKMWENLGLFGPYLSQELSLRGSEALALFRAATTIEKHQHVGESDGDDFATTPEHGYIL